ncbi:hypothetical protein V5O48_015587 [Marasmius crinis-equi]|uniref:Uncharacterized protein n=1 Tax=Marasmius crinis-equi TaxID=585013 RepID=A0ABR3EU59_9AGAR
MSTPTSHVTRNKKIKINESLKRHTREELKEKSEQKKQEKEERKRLQQEQKALEAAEKKQRLAASGQALAKFEDSQVATLTSRSSLRPDLDILKSHQGKSTKMVNTPKTAESCETVVESRKLSIKSSKKERPKKAMATTKSKLRPTNHGPSKDSEAADIDPVTMRLHTCLDAADKLTAFMAWEKEQEAQVKKDLKAGKQKETSERQKEEHKTEKLVVRDVVVENRTTKLSMVIEDTSNSSVGRKRALSNRKEQDANAGKRKKTREICDAKKSNEGSGSESESDSGESDSLSGPELVGGSFDDNESPSTLAAATARKAKEIFATGKAKQSLPENPVLKSLVPADVNSIETKDAQATSASLTTTMPKTLSVRKNIGAKDLPFPRDDIGFYKKKWESLVIPSFLIFSESHKLQFGVGNDPQFIGLVVTKWKKVFPELKDKSNDKVILQVARGDLRQYRTNIAKEALKIVERKVSEVGNSNEERAEWVRKQREKDSFLYETPGPTFVRNGTDGKYKIDYK